MYATDCESVHTFRKFLCLQLFTEVEPQLLLNIKLVPHTKRRGGKRYQAHWNVVSGLFTQTSNALQHNTHSSCTSAGVTRHIKEPKNKEKDSKSLHVFFLFASALFRIQLPGSRE